MPVVMLNKVKQGDHLDPVITTAAVADKTGKNQATTKTTRGLITKKS